MSAYPKAKPWHVGCAALFDIWQSGRLAWITLTRGEFPDENIDNE